MRAAPDDELLAVAPDAPLRAFVGIVVPQAAAMLEVLRADADLQALPTRWLMPEALHITLAFLGESPGRQLAECWPRLAAELAEHRPLRLLLQEPEPFPDAQRPRLVAAPIQGDRPALAALHASLNTALAECGYALDDRPFRPHVSLGRLRPPLLRGQAAAIGAALRAHHWDGTGTFIADRVTLLRSDLFPDGARYTALAESTLDGRR